MEQDSFKPGFIGCGNMGGILAAHVLKTLGAETEVLAADHHPEHLAPLAALGAKTAAAAEAAAVCDILFLGVKPQAMASLAGELRETLARRERRFLAVSMAAGLRTEAVSALFGGCPVIRIMPNLPVREREGVVLWCAGPDVTGQDRARFARMLAGAGLLRELPERLFDAAGAISGCGPAFACMFAEAMTDAGVRCGLPRELSEALSVQTLLGAAADMRAARQTGKSPAELRGEVCSPAGSTIEGVMALEQRAFRAAVGEAVRAAWQRSRELGNDTHEQ